MPAGRLPLTVIAAALLLVSAVTGAAVATTELRDPQVYVSSPTHVDAPTGSRVVDAAGREMPLTARVPTDAGESLTPAVLQPGRYAVVTSRPVVGGELTPRFNSFVVGVDVVDEFSPLASSPVSGPAVLGLAALLAVLAAGCVAAGSSLLRYGLLGAWTVGVAGWVVLGGSSSVTLTGWVSFGAGVAATLAAFAAGRLLDCTALERAALALTGAAATLTAVSVQGTFVPAVAAAVAGTVVVFLEGRAAGLWGRSAAAAGAALAFVAVALVASAGVASAEPAGRVGAAVSTTVEACAQERDTRPQPVVECARALSARAGATLPPQQAGEEVLRIIESVPGTPATMLCRYAGEAMSAAAARWGPGRGDPHALFVDLPAICDYSSMHGIVSSVVADVPNEALGDVIETFCNQASPDPDRLTDREYRAQCWQGAGITLARRLGFGKQFLAVCARAVQEGEGNCPDGVIGEYVELMFRDSLGSEYAVLPAGSSVRSLCSDVPGNLSAACYRYVGKEVQVRGGTPVDGADALQQMCQGDVPQTHQEQCWYSLGMVAARAMSDPVDVVMASVAARCANAQQMRAHSECVAGASNALIGREGPSLDPATLCQWFPAEDRDRQCELADVYQKHLLGSDASDLSKASAQG